MYGVEMQHARTLAGNSEKGIPLSSSAKNRQYRYKIDATTISTDLSLRTCPANPIASALRFNTPFLPYSDSS